MKRVLVVMVVAALGAIGLIQAPAIGATGATCAAKAGVTLSPGISLTASSGTFKSKPERSDIAGDINESLIVELYSR